MRVAIIGAGSAGLSIGWRLASAGVDVTVFDQGKAGGGATWAAAGMLTPWMHEGNSPTDLACREALMLWPNFSRSVLDATGVDLEFRQEGTLRVALTQIAAQALAAKAERQRAHGANVEWLNSWPTFLHQSVCAVARYPDEAQIENRRLGSGLAGALTAAGGKLATGERVERVLVADGKVLGVETSAQRLACDYAVIAAGAWSGMMAGLPTECVPPVVPKKGQILALDSDYRASPFGPQIGGSSVYCVPRSDGRVLVGATVEETGFATHVTQSAIQDLGAQARSMIADADNWPIVEAWAGLRPGTPDDMPILGRTKIAGLIMATGQYRDGILLTPWIGDMISLLIMTGRDQDRLTPFSIDRFHARARA